MISTTLSNLQASIQDKTAFGKLGDYSVLCQAFLGFGEALTPTRIISPSHSNYIFYQYDQDYGYRITRPLNSGLFIESSHAFIAAFERFGSILSDLRHYQQAAIRGNSIFGINSTFKSNHFLGYTVALNKLDGVYYVDPRPEMLINKRLREQIRDFQQFLIEDLWVLSGG